MQVQINCPVQIEASNCDYKNIVSSLKCSDIINPQSDINEMGEKSTPSPNLANMHTPISFLQRGKGLADIRATSVTNIAPLPRAWSWCKDGGNKISPVADQGPCGSCWAVASTTALADRYGVKHDIEAPDLSCAWTILQIGTKGGTTATCQCSTGGLLAQAGCGFESTGVVQEKCYPYEYIIYYMTQEAQGPLPPINQLQSCCSSDEKNMLFTTKNKSTQNIIVLDSYNNVDVTATHNELKAEIATHGPVPATFLVYSDFQSYWNNDVMNAATWEDLSVYNPSTASTKRGGHAVVITGWDTTNEGKEFWEVRNSWGTLNIPPGQGLYQGYFKYAIVDNDPCYLAAPGIDDNSIIGGAVRFMPSDSLPDGYKSKPGTGKRPSPLNYGNFGNGGLNWPFIFLILLLSLSAVILTVYFISKKKKK